MYFDRILLRISTKLLKYKFLFLTLLFSSILSLYNFYKVNYFGFEDVCYGDCYEYSMMGKYKWESVSFYKTRSPLPGSIRSPLIAFILGTSITMTRIEYILFILSCSVLTYFITLNFYNDHIKAFFASFIFGTSSSLIMLATSPILEIPSMFFLLLSIYFIYNQNNSKHKYIFSGIFCGVSFVLRQFVVLYLPLLIFLIYKSKDKRNVLLFLFGFVISGVLLEIILSFFIFGGMIYPPYSFYKLWRYVYIKMPPGTIAQKGSIFYYVEQLFYYYPILLVTGIVGLLISLFSKNKTNFIPLFFMLSTFIPFSIFMHKEFRWILSSLPFISMISSNVFDDKIFTKNIRIIFLILLTMLLFIHNFFIIKDAIYPTSKYSKIDWKKIEEYIDNKQCISNITDKIMYFLKIWCEPFEPITNNYKNDEDKLKYWLQKNDITNINDTTSIFLIQKDDFYAKIKNMDLVMHHYTTYGDQQAIDIFLPFVKSQVPLVYTEDIGSYILYVYSA